MPRAQRTTHTLPVLLALLLAAPAQAQITPKQAAAQLKAATKQALKDFKAELGIAAGQAQGAIKLFELDIDELDASDDPVDALAEALVFHQASVRAAWAAAEQDAAQAAADVVAQLLDAGSAASDAAGPVIGDGGALDDLRLALDAAARKACTKLGKRLEKSIKKAEAGSLLDLRVRLDAPVPPPPQAPGDGTVEVFDSDELAIDLLLAASREDQAGVVRVWASGTADPALGNVLFFYQGAGMPLQLDPAGGRWTTGLDLGSDVLAAVNIVVVVAQGTEGVSVAKAMGMP